MARVSAACCALALVLSSPASADGDGSNEGADEPDPRRAVAVLSFRAGASELPNIEQRLADILSERTSLAVIDADMARRRYGNDIDGAVVDCAGDVSCVARLGRDLDAAEVLLVGVSRFGDVILTLQRINVSAGAVEVRIAEAMAPGQAPGGDALLEYLRRLMPAGDFRRYGIIRIEANIAGAVIHIDEEPRGVTPIAPLRLPAPNEYDIRVAKDGFVPFEVQAAVPPEGEIFVRAVLSKQEKAWYARWWLWALVGTTATAVGVGTGLYLRRNQDVPIVITPSPS